MSGVLGKWKLYDSQNFDDFLKALGVGIAWRKLGSTSKPVVEIVQNNDEWSIKTSTLLKTSEIKFKLGEEFEENRMDGTTVKTVVNLEGDKLVQKQFGDKEVVIIREKEGDDLKVTCKVDDIVSVRKYKKE